MQKILLFFVMLSALFSSLFGGYAETKENVTFIGHRGYSFRYLENTEDAFIGAAAHGSGGAETDVRVTKDGVLVCSHNSAAVMRDGTEMEIADHTYAELTAQPLRNLKTFTPVYLCTFERYLQIMKEHDMICFVEFKGAFTEENILKAFNMAAAIYDLSKCPLQSYDMNNLLLARELFPELPVMLTRNEPGPLVDYALAQGISIDMDLHSLTAETVEAFHAAGLEVGAWTANTRAQIAYCLSLGVDYIESDVYAN